MKSHARLDKRLYLSRLQPILVRLACPLPSGLGGIFGRPTPPLSLDLSYCSLTKKRYSLESDDSRFCCNVGEERKTLSACSGAVLLQRVIKALTSCLCCSIVVLGSRIGRFDEQSERGTAACGDVRNAEGSVTSDLQMMRGRRD